MTKVICDHCGKFLFETEKKYKSEMAIEALDKKYFTKHMGFGHGFKIFCCLECVKSWSEKNVTPEEFKDIMYFFTDNAEWWKSKLGVK